MGQIQDSAFAIVKFGNDVIVQWTSVRAAPGRGFNNHVIYGSEGSIDYGANLCLRGKEPQNVNELFNESLSDEERERLFEKFSRLRNRHTSDKRGSGLGLFLCRQILELHGGRVWAESEEGRWARFCFSLPTSSSSHLADP